MPLSTGATGNTLLNDLKGSPYDMFLTSGVTPGDMQSHANIMDITSIMKASSTDENNPYTFAEETSIYDRMYPDKKDYYLGTDNKIYGAPVFMNTSHLYYNSDLVANRGLYIKAGSTDTALQYTKVLAQAQLGVDGVKGTADDGLPETWAQLKLWLEKIESVNIVPIHYSGLYQQHMDWALGQFWADFEGATNVKACYTFDGTVMTDLIDTIDDEGNITYYPETAITPQNGYKVQRQEGRYRVMQLAKYLADSMSTQDKLIHNNAFAKGETHTTAQGTYLTSRYGKNPIMLFAESSYWETEAADDFKKCEGKGGGRLDSKLAILPTPKYSRDDVGPSSRGTIVANDALNMFIHTKVENASNKKAVEDFFMYFNQASNMDMQFVEASSLRPYTFEIDSEQSAKMSYLQKDYYNLMNNTRTDVVFACDNNNLYRANAADFSKDNWIFYSQYRSSGDEKAFVSIKTFKDNNSHENLVTPENYFFGFERVYTYKAGANPSKWEQMLNRAGISVA